MGEVIHVHSGGLVGGYAVCEARHGRIQDDADKSNCEACLQQCFDYVSHKYPIGHALYAEVARGLVMNGFDPP